MLLSNENAISSGGYQISNSLRFQSASSQYANRTPASAGNRQKWTWSAWVKRGALTTPQFIMFSATSGTGTCQIGFQGSGNDGIVLYDSSLGPMNVTTTPQYRDPSAWYHIVIAVDTTQATAANRVLMYVNGVQVTAFSTATYPSQNANTGINNNVTHGLGTQYSNGSNAGNYFDGYMAEFNFIDGQALTPSSFGSTDPTSGQWVAAKYTGTYGTNGFYLPFSNGTSTTTLGADSSGNSNNWTLTNFTRSAGVSDCWMTDVPSGNGSSVSATQPNSNYSVWNPLETISGTTVSNGNLLATSTANTKGCTSTIRTPTADKVYFEVTITANTYGATNGMLIGLVNTSSNWSPQTSASFGYQLSNGYYYAGDGQKASNNVFSAYGSSYTTNDVVGVAVDAVGGTITFYKNNVSQGTAFSSVSGVSFLVNICNANGSAGTMGYAINFGQRSFAYTPPSGFKALCTANLPVATIKQGNKYMDATTYTGNGSSQSVVNAGGFKPDFVWIKRRSSPVANNNLFNSVTGIYNRLFSDTTGAEVNSPTTLTAFNTNGFSLSTDGDVNSSGGSFVGWQWQAGQGSTSSNTNGSITSTVSVSTTAGFSVVTYTGTGANATVGHGLGVAPKMVIIKQRNTGRAWVVYDSSLPSAAYNLYLNTTAAQNNDATIFNSTAPISSVFSVGTSVETNQSTGTYVAYCFAEIAGFSKFGSYTGNGSADGTFCYTGFRPKYVMIKNASVAGNGWEVFDTSRSPYNLASVRLEPNSSAAEVTGSAGEYIDILSNGFKIRTTWSTINGSGNTMIFACFAENPFQNSNAF